MTTPTAGAIRPESEAPVFSARECAEALVQARHPLAASDDFIISMPRFKLAELLEQAAREGVKAGVKAANWIALEDDAVEMLDKAAALIGLLSSVDEDGCMLTQHDAVRTAQVAWSFLNDVLRILKKSTRDLSAIDEANCRRGAT